MKFLAALLLFVAALASAARAETIVIGGDFGWIEGVCYQPVQRAMVGDVVEFNFFGHDVHRLFDRSQFDACTFTGALTLAGVGEAPYRYEITEQDAEDGTLYFVCTVGDHCAGGTQKVQIQIEPFMGGQEVSRVSAPVSLVTTGVSSARCAEIQNGDGVADSDNQASLSDCSDPIIQEDGRYYVTCLSPPATMTPGGVINSLFILHYPYPKDRRVVVGLRTWEFVQDIPGAPFGTVEPVPVNQLYVHHLSGRVVLGQGTEGIRRSEPDAPFASPYGLLTGDEGDNMIFHIIDLREVDDWLPCIECRCKDANGTYLDIGGGDGDSPQFTGGVSCCTNCTDLEGPTVDYRMRYNVSYSDIPEDAPVKEVIMLTADVSPVVNKNIEFDVPMFENLPVDFQKPGDPMVQRLVREMPFREMFKHEFFGTDYYGPDTVRLFRCVGHLHVAAISMYLENEQGEVLCAGDGIYGTDPSKDKGFLTAIAVDDYQGEPKEFSADTVVRLITEYNATELHTGVMGMLFIFIDGDRDVYANEADLSIEVCASPICDTSLLPQLSIDDIPGEVCEDTLASNPACQFGGLCDCDIVINAAESTGCGGTYSNPSGDILVDSVCAKSCGCPATNCQDTLASSPMCNFAGLCDCETFVSDPNSSGCGGVFTSEMGDLLIDDFCPSYCNACPETTREELFEETFVEELEADLQSKCLYATEECREALYNAYSCGIERLGIESLELPLRRATVTHASRLALKYSKLGSSSLHSGPDAAAVARARMEVGECEEEEEDPTVASSGGDDGENQMSSALARGAAGLLSCLLVVGYYFL